MSRRTATLIIVAVLALTSCSANDGGDPPASRSAIPPASTGPQPTTPSAGASARPQTTAASAPAPVGAAPNRSFPVRVRKLQLSRGEDRPLPTTVWYPATGKGPYPVIVFSHGLTGRPEDYASLLTRWARAGFVVAGAAYPHTSRGAAEFTVLDLVNQPVDASYVLTELLALNRKQGDPLENRLDETHVAAAGHSGGGITTLGMLSGNRDKRLTAAVVLAGRQLLAAPFTGPETPVLFVHGKLDRTVRYADGLAAFEAVPWPRALLTLPRGGHITTGGPDFTRVVTTTTDFWRWSLYGDAPARKRLAATNNFRDDL
ncbi:chlorophyllase/cutinase-like alpha/beta fold protein [Actinoplanes sp. NPDC049316]|uniref:alpha/beta hydrolase family protein n=1 Tax=Actinoplanes sp. NPDC049316 TaxID=3154727 RepID=UPI00341A9773